MFTTNEFSELEVVRLSLSVEVFDLKSLKRYATNCVHVLESQFNLISKLISARLIIVTIFLLMDKNDFCDII